jgi:hypothetical protein
MLLAEGMAALSALEIVEYVRVDLSTDGGPRSATGCITEECADQSSGQSTED